MHQYTIGMGSPREQRSLEKSQTYVNVYIPVSEIHFEIVFAYLCVCVCLQSPSNKRFYQLWDECKCMISIISHTLQRTIRAVISTLTCTSMACNSTSDSECYLAVRVHVRVLLLP